MMVIIKLQLYGVERGKTGRLLIENPVILGKFDMKIVEIFELRI